ncbi:PepSY domain-containing protein [Shewanella sp. NIFS-20-20]|uniref:PepSY domain-containing protein n=1 Tax=Shewanella sp. NIFS-20-20 TaxID=2853806 RepID=UPI001C4749DB|nr:PepSY domain-containing protein [Shewanella sp. NIFS-20-20]MBV7316089.1 PepSY domain-containing protein [Shewanella sp. NIFS-20-20]
MKPWVYGLLLQVMSFSAFAQPQLMTSLQNSNLYSPMSILDKVTKLSPGIVSEFDTRLDGERLVYLVEVVDTKDKSHTEYIVNAESGAVLRVFKSKLQAKDMAEYRAANSLVAKEHDMQHFLKQAINNQPGRLIQAKLDNDLGINYLEFTILDGSKAHTQAFNIDRMQPIPLLTRD